MYSDQNTKYMGETTITRVSCCLRIMEKWGLTGRETLYIRGDGIRLGAAGILPPEVEQKNRHNEAEAHYQNGNWADLDARRVL